MLFYHDFLNWLHQSSFGYIGTWDYKVMKFYKPIKLKKKEKKKDKFSPYLIYSGTEFIFNFLVYDLCV